MFLNPNLRFGYGVSLVGTPGVWNGTDSHRLRNLNKFG